MRKFNDKTVTTDMPLTYTRKLCPLVYCLDTNSLRSYSACRVSTAEAWMVACWTACAT